MTLEELGGWPAILGPLQDGLDLTGDQTEAVLANVLAGQATDAQIAAFIVGLRQKGETVDELAGMVRAMHAAATPLVAPDEAIDIVGMGGAPSRRKSALNVSTMACFVASAAGAIVCKHGNRKASSTSGSFDLLEVLGVNFDVEPERLEAIVAEVGLGFAFARTFHPAMRHVGPVRTQLGIPTVFNVLGPLANPARLTRQVMGVADLGLATRMAEVLKATGSVHSWIVTGHGPLDELSTTGPTNVTTLRDGAISATSIDASALGLRTPAPGELNGGDAAANAAIMHRVFAGEHGEVGAARDIVLLNAAAGLVVAGVASDMGAGLQLGADAIDSGAAAAKLAALVTASK